MKKEKEIVIELNEKRRKPWHAASSWQMHSKKKKKNWQMDMIGWKLGVGKLIREYCGNYFYLNSKFLNKM